MSYSQDLRERVLSAYEKQEGSIRQLAERFKLHFTTVHNWLKHYRESGSKEPKKTPRGRFSVIQPEHQSFLEELYGQQSDLTHAQVGQRFFERYGVFPQKWVISRAHRRLGISRKKNLSRSQT